MFKIYELKDRNMRPDQPGIPDRIAVLETYNTDDSVEYMIYSDDTFQYSAGGEHLVAMPYESGSVPVFHGDEFGDAHRYDYDSRSDISDMYRTVIAVPSESFVISAADLNRYYSDTGAFLAYDWSLPEKEHTIEETFHFILNDDKPDQEDRNHLRFFPGKDSKEWKEYADPEKWIGFFNDRDSKLGLYAMPEQTPEVCLAVVQKDGNALKYVKHQTPEICLAAVKNNGASLRFVEEQTPKICLAAVRQNGLTLSYVKDQTPQICMAAVKRNGEALQFVKNQTPEICLAAVQKNGYALEYVQEQTQKLCAEAVLQTPKAIQYAKYQTPEMCLEAVRNDGYLLQYVKEQTPEICMAAVKEDGFAIKFVEEQTPELCMAAVRENPNCLGYIRNQTLEICSAAFHSHSCWDQDVHPLLSVREQTPEICLEAVKCSGMALEYVKEQTPEICLTAVQKNPKAFRFVKEQTPEICLAAVQGDGRNLQHVKEQTPEICNAAVKQNREALPYAKEIPFELWNLAVSANPDLRENDSLKPNLSDRSYLDEIMNARNAIRSATKNAPKEIQTILDNLLQNKKPAAKETSSPKDTERVPDDIAKILVDLRTGRNIIDTKAASAPVYDAIAK